MPEDQSDDQVFSDSDDVINEVFELEDDIEDDTESPLFTEDSDDDEYEADIPDGLLDEEQF
ncbi:MAG TPA: hypothetical protein VI752_00620 [Candidatus Paceibacterota bacterium]|nr:hypothetical protein [Patescibacteria group bacterium]